MRHFQGHREALRRKAGESIHEPELRACDGCGKDFQLRRPWQKHCSARCCQRAYVQRQCEAPTGYYGAWFWRGS